MKNADMPAMPMAKVTTKGKYNGLDTFDVVDGFEGLTKREYAAIKIMAGFASDPDTAGTVEEVSEYAVKWADALLKELEK